MKNQQLVRTIIISVILYAFSTGASYAVFNFLGKGTKDVATTPIEGQVEDKKSKFRIDPNLPLTEACPLNGMYYTKKQKEIWETRRPLAVMVSNAKEGRPVAGLSLADIVYEGISEGGITRYMPIFFCGATLGNIEVAPIRSARSHFLDWVSEYDALHNHVGGSNTYGDNEAKTDPRADAIGQIRKYGIKDLDQFGIGYPDCYRNPDRVGRPIATEHTMICKTDNLYEIAKERGWTNEDEDGVSWDKGFTSWKFKDDAKVEDRSTIASISFGFWEDFTDYSVVWSYDQQTNSYSRSNGGEKQIDTQTDEPILAKNIVVQLVKETGPVDENKHLLYETQGQGKALIFQDGMAISGTWQKKNRLARTLFYDDKGKEIKFNRGQIWIEVIPLDNKVSY